MTESSWKPGVALTDPMKRGLKVLLNSRMYAFCKADEELPVQLKINTSDELRTLFENEIFVVAAVGQTE